MKKSNFLLFGLVALFCMLIIGCSDQENIVNENKPNEFHFDKLMSEINEIELNNFDLSEDQLRELVELMFTDEAAYNTLIEVRKLSPNDVVKFYTLLRQKSIETAERTGENIDEFKQMMPFLTEMTHEVNSIALKDHNTTFHNLSFDIQNELITQEYSKIEVDDSLIGLRGCSGPAFNRWLHAVSAWNKVNANDKKSVKNNWYDIPCDIELRYPSYGYNVTGSTNRAFNLLMSFGGGLSGRDFNGKTYLIVGTVRAWWYGMSASSVKNEIKLVP